MDMKTFESTMTVFYNKRTGVIKSLCQGVQTMDYFGDEAEDYALIWDYIHIDYNELIFRNTNMFKVENERLIFKDSAFSNFINN